MPEEKTMDELIRLVLKAAQRKYRNRLSTLLPAIHVAFGFEDGEPQVALFVNNSHEIHYRTKDPREGLQRMLKFLEAVPDA